MATQLSLSQHLPRPTTSLQERIEGTRLSRVFAEFVSTSALFPILDAIRVITATSLKSYLSEPVHYVLFGAAFFQAWFLGTAKKNSWQERFVGNLLGFSLYAILDMVIEGPEFFGASYHWLFGLFSLLMATLSAAQIWAAHRPGWSTAITLLLNSTKVALFPAMYFIAEQELAGASIPNGGVWQEFMSSSGHRFIVYGILFFGVLLGLAEAQRMNYAGQLRHLAQQLKKYSEWSLDPSLIETSIDNPNKLALQRVEKTMLFMDIRGFTAWSEHADPQAVVEMLNRFYNAAEQVIRRHNGHKPNFTADEIMTRFADPQTALDAAQDLQQTLIPLLHDFDLMVGIGLNTGEVIEGMMGSSSTRKYDIIGDAVNTAKRLESSAGRGEIVMAATTYQALSRQPVNVALRTLQVKGKSETLQAVAVLPATAV